MSAFVVSKDTVDVIVSFCFVPHPGYSARVALRERLGGGSRATPESLGAALWSLNHDAVNARYREQGAPERYVYERRHAPLAAVYKAVSCLIYQCSEGDMPQTDAYAALVRLKAAVADEIIGSMPEYEAAPWG